MPQSMGFPATGRGGSLEAQRYYAPEVGWYWVSVQGGWVASIGAGGNCHYDSSMMMAFCPGGFMSVWDIFDSIGRGIDTGLRSFISAGDTVVKHVGDAAQAAEDTVKENPVASAVVAAVATGGVAMVAAPAIAAAAGSAGLLGAASTGTAISTLHGAALTKASLAALGGGAVAAGGGGMAVGTAVVAGTGAALGGGAAAAIGTPASNH